MTENLHNGCRKWYEEEVGFADFLSVVLRADRTLDCGNFLYHVKGAPDQTAEINI